MPGHAAIMSCLYNGNFDYKECGLLDRTHIRFFGLKNIEDLFTQADLKIIEAQFVVKAPEQTELVSEWLRLPPAIQEALMTGPYSTIYQVVVKAVPYDHAGNALALIPPQGRQVVSPVAASLRTRVARHLSPQLKRKIRQKLMALGIHL